MKQVRVLLVDDSAEFLRSAIDFLSRDARVEVVGWASDGHEGVRLARDLDPDLVLMDLEMPVMDGLAATRLIKARPASPWVVIVTLWQRQDDRRIADGSGADGFICKSQFTHGALAVVDALFTGPAPFPRELNGPANT